MIVVCWSVKGGSGTTVVATSLALLHATRGVHTTLVDTGGDAAACLGMPESYFPPIASEGCRSTGPHGLEVARCTRDQLPAVIEQLSDRCLTETVIVDAGVGELPNNVWSQADYSLLVVRSCFLALRRVAHLARKPHGVILVNEPGRVLRRPDVEGVAGAPVEAEVEWDPVVARAVDSGVLAGRLPRSLRDGLGGLWWLP